MDGGPTRQEYDEDAQLVRQALMGDRAAFDALVWRYRPRLLLTAFSRTGDREATEDLVVEVLANAWRQLLTLRHHAAFAAWLKTAMLNACRNWRRSLRSPDSALDDIGEIAAPHLRWDPLEAVLRQERRQAWREALRSLPDPNRLAFVLHVVGQYRCEEIAQLLGVTTETVAGRVHRARQQLRRLLGEAEAGPPVTPPYLRNEERSDGCQ